MSGKKRLNKQSRIWKRVHGEIPVDSDGRSFDVHHIDGNSDNNDIDNLVALSINDHYKVHLDQGDYGAAMLISRRMKVKPADLSEVARKQMKLRVELGICNFQEKGFATVKDKHGNTYRVSMNDPRISSGELVGVNKGYSVVKDSYGNRLRVKNDDPRLLTGELVSINSGRKQKKVHNNRGGNLGKKWTQVNKESPTQKCKYCDFVGRGSHVARFHNERCKKYNEC